jgi:hypothetical protein
MKCRKKKCIWDVQRGFLLYLRESLGIAVFVVKHANLSPKFVCSSQPATCRQLIVHALGSEQHKIIESYAVSSSKVTVNKLEAV